MKNTSFPESYKKDFLDVGQGHKIYYELYGNPNGKPILFLHGGPGAGFHEKDKRFFDPGVWNVIFFDQRGSGRSTPFATLENNKTQNLISDINTLLNHVGIEKVLLFGGSWGSTLALIYAIHHPEKVAGMVLRSIFLCSDRDSDFMYGDFVRCHFPELWERFMKLVPETSRRDPVSYYLYHMMFDDKESQKKYAYEWAFYESRLLKMNVSDEEVAADLETYDYTALSKIEAYYIKNHAFLPPNFILENAYKLPKVPTAIAHGRFDLVCPPINAYDLHKKIPNSTLKFVIAGHSSSEPELEAALIDELKRLEKIV